MQSPDTTPYRPFLRGLGLALLALGAVALAACGGGGAGGGGNWLPPVEEARGLQHFGYVAGSGEYVYGHPSVTSLPIEGVPGNADMGRIAMTQVGPAQVMFVMRTDSRSDLYVFALNGDRFRYQGEVQLLRAPKDTDWRSFGAIYAQGGYRLYLRSTDNPTNLYQFYTTNLNDPFVWGGGPAIGTLATSNVPADADPSRFTMFFDGSSYRQAMFVKDSTDTLYQFGWNGGSYAYGHNSRSTVTIVGAPHGTYTDQAKILHQGSGFHLYQLAP